jgi:hypothetical protein
MRPKSPPFSLEEHPGDLYPDLETAQRLALPSMARDLAATIRALLEEGVLIIEEGQIKPNPRLEDKNREFGIIEIYCYAIWRKDH